MKRIFFSFFKTLESVITGVLDFLTLIGPSARDGNGFAFLVHPRDISDVYRHLPFFRYLPEWVVLWIVKHLPPLTISKVSGVTSVITGEPIKGFILTIGLTPMQMKKNPRHTIKKIRQMALLAKKRGARIIGLGALLPSLTHYGLSFRQDLGKEKEPPFITTGHALTAYTIVQYLQKLVRERNGRCGKIAVAIVGAAGSTGSFCSKLIAKRYAGLEFSSGLELLLVDLPEKQKALEGLIEVLGRIAPQLAVSKSEVLGDIRNAEYVITVTNAPRSIIKSHHVRSGMVIIDDSQPRNTSPELLEEGVWVIDVLARVPGLDCPFDFGFSRAEPGVTFTCLAETAMLAACEYCDDFSIGFIDISLMDQLENMIARTCVEMAPLHSFGKPLGKEEIEKLMMTK